MRRFLADLRYGVRALVRVPSFAIAVIAVLAARHRRQHRHLQHRQRGAAAAAAVRGAGSPRSALPRAAAERVSRHAAASRSRRPTSTTGSATRTSFEAMAIYRLPSVHADGQPATPRRVVAGAVGADFFQIVRTPPRLGRVFLAEEDAARRAATSSSSAMDSGRVISARRTGRRSAARSRSTARPIPSSASCRRRSRSPPGR